MYRDIINKLLCPNCSSPLFICYIFYKKGDRILDGILKCKCSYYPIVEEILILEHDEKIDKILKVCKMEFLSILKWGKYKLKLLWKKRFIIFYLINSRKKTANAIEILSLYNNYKKKGIDLTYFKYRFSEQTFWLLYPFLVLFDMDKDGYFLDLCAGVGQCSFIISKIKNPKNIICIEKDLLELLIAKKYFVNSVNTINYNIRDNLPFKNSIFNSVLFSDAFFYLNSEQKIHIVTEMERISEEKGLMIILHTHNSLAPESLISKPVIPEFLESPSFYTRLFKRSNCRIIPDEKLLENFLFENKLDLKRVYSLNELKNARGLSLVVSSDEKYFNVFNNIDEYLIKYKDNLIINPIYTISYDGEFVILKKQSPEKWVEIEYQFALSYMPNELRIKKEIIKNLNSRLVQNQNIIDELNNLIKSFVLINVPKSFV
jgi:ubiquinone/menaquinone biosynthesis C-methylase UbiE